MAIAREAESSGRKVVRRGRLARDLWPYLLVAPAVVATVVSTYGPLLGNAFVSLSAYNLRLPKSRSTYVGVDNYVALLGATKTWQIVGQTLVYAFATTLLGVVLALAVAVLLRPPLRGRPLFGRGLVLAIVLLPWIMPPVVSAFIWKYLYDPFGPINGFLVSAGVIERPITFLTDVSTSIGPVALPMIALIQVGIWATFPFLFVFANAAMSSIPRDLYEAAELEGASNWQAFRRITLPLIAPVVEAAIFLIIVIRFGAADLPLLLTNGAPLDKTNTLGVFTYQTAFASLQIGKAAAIGMLLLIVTLPFAILYIRRSQRQIGAL
jgi:multiple sugar transport system permease protein